MGLSKGPKWEDDPLGYINETTMRLNMKQYEKCPTCDGVGKIVKKEKMRKKCSECQDHNHGCFGSGKPSGYGYHHCCEWKDCEGIEPIKVANVCKCTEPREFYGNGITIMCKECDQPV